MIDTHCHLTYEPLYQQLGAVLDAARDAGVDRMITIGTSPDDATRAVELATKYPHIFAAAGIHPHYSHDHRDRHAVQDMLREYVQHPRIVAIGEMGLDKHYPEPPLADQVRVFEWQLQVAAELTHPIIIHNREATDQTLDMIRASGIAGDRFVFHCFTGSRAEHEKILAIGAMVSFTGITTFKTATDIAECARATPIERLMIETDSPYLTPEPHRKVRPNQPAYVKHVYEFIAKQRQMIPADFVRHCDANADRFFRLSAV